MNQNETFRILAKDNHISNDTWKTGLNNNDIIIGPSGSNKTRGYVIPNIMQCNESMIISDIKGNIQKQTSQLLKMNGYKILNIDFMDFFNSDGYNPLDYIRYDNKRLRYNTQDIKTIVACIVPIEDPSQPFWELSARMYLESIIAYVMECLPKNEHNLDSVAILFSQMNTGVFEQLFKELNELNPNSFAAKQYNMYKGTARAEKMYESIRGILAEKLSMIGFNDISELANKDNNINFSSLGKEKIALFVTVSDTDRSMDNLASLFYTQAIHVLCNSADKDYKDNRLDIPVRVILDDFASNIYIPDFEKTITTIRSREIYVSVILQSISQLESLYGHANTITILNNADNLLYLGGQDVETAQYIAIKSNKPKSSILNMPLSQAWLFTRGSTPKQVEKFQLQDHNKFDCLM